MPSGWGRAHVGVMVMYRTGSTKHSSVVRAHLTRTLCMQAEEGRENMGVEMILFHVYKYKILLRANGREQSDWAGPKADNNWRVLSFYVRQRRGREIGEQGGEQ